MHLRASIFAFSSILLAAACSSSPSISVPDDGGATTDAPGGNEADVACDAAANAQCALEWRCSSFLALARWADQATCVARSKAQCLTALAAPSTGNTPAAVQTCASARASETCADFFADTPPDACRPKAGALADGKPCTFDGQCASAFCRLGPTSGCGSCGAPAKLGESCASFGCDVGLTCVKATQICEKPGALNDPCDAASPCGAQLSCVGATHTSQGKCEAAVATVGAACDPREQTAPRCDATLGLRCGAVTKVCEAVKQVGAGSPCGALADGSFADCAAGGFCQIPSGAKQGTCVAPAADGAACSTANGPTCESPARCVGTTTTSCVLESPAACVGG